MNDKDKTKEQLLGELAKLRQQVTELEASESQRKQAEEALRESEDRYRSFVQNFQGIAYRGDMNFVPLFFHGAVEEITGYTEEELTAGQPRWDQIIQPDDLSKISKSVEKIHSTPNYVTEREYRIKRKDGQIRWVNELIQNICDTAGQPIFVQGALYDITERKQAEEELRRAHERFRTVLDSLDAVVYVVDMETYEVLFLNRYSMDIWGDLTGKVCWQGLQQGQTGPCLFCTNDRLLDASGNPASVYVWEFQNTINREWYECRDQAIQWLDGRIVRMEIAANITERKRAEEQLQQYASELEDANAELYQYTYIASHDLQTPLRAIHIYADFLREDLADSLDGEQKTYLYSLGRAVNEASELVEDMLEFSQIGWQSDPIKAVDTGLFLQKLLVSLDLPAEVEIVMEEDWPTIEVEPTLLRQVFKNLISNAVKFNKSFPKRVELGWSPPKSPLLGGTKGGRYEFFIRDNGIGIAPRHQEQIFRMFERLHLKEEYEGTGIGLAIVNKAVGKLGGKIWVESEPGEGSTFFVSLPQKQQAKRHKPV